VKGRRVIRGVSRAHTQVRPDVFALLTRSSAARSERAAFVRGVRG
jgi:hypothetical protein